MSRANALFSEDSDSISFYSAEQAGIKILVIPYNVDRTAYKLFQEILGIHKQKGIGCLCLDEHVNIAAVMVLTSGHRTEKPKRLDAVVVSKGTATALQEVYIISLTHTPFLFLVANIRDFCDNNKYFRKNLH